MQSRAYEDKLAMESLLLALSQEKRVPRFFFHIRDGVDVPDTEGVDLRDCRVALEQALRFAGAVISDNAKTTKLGEYWYLEVTDSNGLILFRLDFHISATAATMGVDWRKS